MKWFYLVIGGIMGTVCRYVVSGLVYEVTGSNFPFCGAYSTFSTWILETANLMKDGETARAFWNVALSVLIGFFVFRLGVVLGKWI